MQVELITAIKEYCPLSVIVWAPSDCQLILYTALYTQNLLGMVQYGVSMLQTGTSVFILIKIGIRPLQAVSVYLVGNTEKGNL